MIKKLKSRIFFLILISLLVLVLSLITIFAISNYTSTIRMSTILMDRVTNFELNKPEGRLGEIIQEEHNIEGVFTVEIRNSEITQSNTKNDELENYAKKIAASNKEEGVVGNYLYKVMRTPQNTIRIVFMENEKTIQNLKLQIIFSVTGAIVSLICIYWLAKKLSELIVKPVEETFEKQKQFISDASHELKTPLAVIEANADVLENEIGDNKWLKYIQNETGSMDKLINELLLLAKTENTDSIKTYQKFNLSEEIQMIVSAFESMAYEKNVEIETEIQEDVEINGDREDIKHILSTLVDNAIKHSAPEKSIIVKLSKEKNEISLSVKNVGQEIPEEEREKIFERFYRIDKSRNRNEKRYGLGLAIAKATVEKYARKN